MFLFSSDCFMLNVFIKVKLFIDTSVLIQFFFCWTHPLLFSYHFLDRLLLLGYQIFVSVGGHVCMHSINSTINLILNKLVMQLAMSWLHFYNFFTVKWNLLIILL